MNYQDFYCTNSCILDATNPHEGYVSKDGRVAAIRYGEKQFIIIQDGRQEKVCHNYKTALAYCKRVETANKKSKSNASLKID